MMTHSGSRQPLVAFLSCKFPVWYLLCSKIMGWRMFLPGLIHPNSMLGYCWRYWICLFASPLVPQHRSIQANRQTNLNNLEFQLSWLGIVSFHRCSTISRTGIQWNVFIEKRQSALTLLNNAKNFNTAHTTEWRNGLHVFGMHRKFAFEVRSYRIPFVWIVWRSYALSWRVALDWGKHKRRSQSQPPTQSARSRRTKQIQRKSVRNWWSHVYKLKL